MRTTFRISSFVDISSLEGRSTYLFAELTQGTGLVVLFISRVVLVGQVSLTKDVSIHTVIVKLGRHVQVEHCES
jgi:hypothetical protein